MPTEPEEKQQPEEFDFSGFSGPIPVETYMTEEGGLVIVFPEILDAMGQPTETEEAQEA